MLLLVAMGSGIEELVQRDQCPFLSSTLVNEVRIAPSHWTESLFGFLSVLSDTVVG